MKEPDFRKRKGGFHHYVRYRKTGRTRQAAGAGKHPPETAVIKKAQELGLHTVMGMEMLVNQVSAICKFILDWEAPEEAKKIGIDF